MSVEMTLHTDSAGEVTPVVGGQPLARPARLADLVAWLAQHSH
jgi:hypothetical protein